MARKGGLGQGKTVEQPEDLLDSVFGGKAPAKEPVGKTDTPPPAPAGKADPKKDKVGKYFLLDRDLAKTLKLHAVMHETKEIAFIEAALREFFEKHAE